MQYALLYPGAFPMLKVELNEGESLKAESGAMIAMSSTVDIEGKMEGGFLGGLTRKLLTGESFFLQNMVAKRGNGEVMLAHSQPGEIAALEMDGSTEYILQKNGFLAGSETLSISSKAQNLTKGLFSGEGFFVVRISGTGILFVSSFGSIHTMDIPAGEQFTVDNAHLVAWPSTIEYTIDKASAGWFSSVTSGEGLVCRFTGPGRIMIQTRNPGAFGLWMRQFIPVSSD
jgi:uncharacterized protein (TIGR00266 family)